MKCFVCENSVEEKDAIYLTSDGDSACGPKCEEKFKEGYEKIFSDANKFANYIENENDEAVESLPSDWFEVDKVAFNCWEQMGKPEGRDQEFWYMAEKIVAARLAVEKQGALEERLEKWREKNLPSIRTDIILSWTDFILPVVSVVFMLALFALIPLIFIFGIDLIQSEHSFYRYCGSLLVLVVSGIVLRFKLDG